MPGTPPTSPVFGAPRYADSDEALFGAQVNGVTDVFDAKATLNTDPRLSDTRTPTDGSVTTAKLADGSVTKAKLADQTAIHLPGDFIWSGASSRAGALLCDGSAVSRTTYAALYAAIGTEYGAGDGSTTFNLPDLRGRMPMGAGTGPGLSPRSVGQSGGAESHTHTVPSLSVPALAVPGHHHGPGSISIFGGTHHHGFGNRWVPTYQGGWDLVTVSTGTGTAQVPAIHFISGNTFASINQTDDDGFLAPASNFSGVVGNTGGADGDAGFTTLGGATGTGTSGSTSAVSPFTVGNWFIKT